MNTASAFPRHFLQWAAVLGTAATLAGCYVVPMQPIGSTPVPGPLAVPAAPPAPVSFSARLYPANEQAAQYGMVPATVTNDLNGHGWFNTAIGGESFHGDATRVAGSARDGIANGVGNRGGFLACRYTMNSPTLGSGSCRLSDGAVFTMHVGG